MILAGWSAQEETAALELLDRYASDVRVYKEQIASIYSGEFETEDSRTAIQIELNRAYEMIRKDDNAKGAGASRSKLMDVYGELGDASIYAQTGEKAKLNEALVMVGREMQNYRRVQK